MIPEQHQVRSILRLAQSRAGRPDGRFLDELKQCVSHLWSTKQEALGSARASRCTSLNQRFPLLHAAAATGHIAFRDGPTADRRRGRLFSFARGEVSQAERLLRYRKPARPSRPLPSRTKLPGSGTTSTPNLGGSVVPCESPKKFCGTSSCAGQPDTGT